MRLLRLSLADYRRFARLEMQVPQGVIVVVGPNAQGKTSLLEAVYFLATFASYQADSDRDLIRFGALEQPLAVARITADFVREGREHHLEVRIIREPNHTLNGRVRKEVLLNGVKTRLVEAVGRLSAVFFVPQMLESLTGSPERRRRFFNLILAQAFPDYAATLAEYNKVLSQRNALLKQAQEKPSLASLLDPWDAQLTALGARLMQARIEGTAALDRLAMRVHDRLTQGREVLRLAYWPSYEPLPPPPGQALLPLHTPVDRTGLSLERLAEGYRRALAHRRSEDLARGVTTLGPHRDDWQLLANGVDLGRYGSRGQVRTALLSLKLAEAHWLTERLGESPVLLLDEVLAELDAHRRGDLLAYLDDHEQVLLTTAELGLFDPAFLRRTTRWFLRDGLVERVEAPEEFPSPLG